MIKPLPKFFRLLFWPLLIVLLLAQCKKTEETPVTPTTPTVNLDPIKPGVNVGFGAQLLTKTEYDKLALLAEPLAGARKAASNKDPNLPASYDLSSNTPPVGNQGMQGSCVAWSVAYAARSYFNKIAKSTSYKASDGTLNTESLLSPAFVYNQIKTGGCGGGSFISSALDFIKNTGVCTLKDMPYDEGNCSTQPTADQKQRAASYKIKDWGKITITTANLKKYLYFDYPIIVAALLDDNFKQLKQKDANGEYIWQNQDAATASSAHAMVIVGYDDTRKAFKIQNSWSDRWANKGFIWLSYDNLPTAIYEAYVMVSGDKTYQPPSVVTGLATKSSTGQAILAGSITTLGDEPVIKYGICVSNVRELPTTQFEVSGKAITALPFSFTISPALTGSKLYYRAFAQTPTTIAYGDTASIAVNQSNQGGTISIAGLSKDLTIVGEVIGIGTNEGIGLSAKFTNRGDANTYSDYGFIIVPYSYRKGAINAVQLNTAPRLSLGPLTKTGFGQFNATFKDVTPNTSYKYYAYVKNAQGTFINDTTVARRPDIYQTLPLPVYSGNASITTLSQSINGISGAYLPQTQTFYYINGNSKQIYKLKTGETQPSVLAGKSGGGTASKDGTGTEAIFGFPTRITTDGSGNLYVADTPFIRKVSPQGVVTTISGNGTYKITDGSATQASYKDIQYITLDRQNNLWIIDILCIRKMSPDGTVTTITGDKSAPYRTGNDPYVDGSLAAARFSNPVGLTVDKDGIVYAIDGNRIRKITQTTVSTLVGREINPPDYQWYASSSYFSYYSDGQLPAIDLYLPQELITDDNGNLYILDTWSPGGYTMGTTIRKLTPTGNLTTLIGKPGDRSTKDGSGSNASINTGYNAALIWVDGALLLSQGGNLRKITL